MSGQEYAILSKNDQYTKFQYNNRTISFLHGKDLIKYLSIKEWDQGYLVVDCLGKIKGVYEDYIDLNYILENLYMDPEAYLQGIKGVVIADEVDMIVRENKGKFIHVSNTNDGISAMITTTDRTMIESSMNDIK
jgi:hypothetical protein